MVVIVFASLTLLSLPILVAQYSIRHDEFSSEQHLERFRRLDWRGSYSETWSLAGLCDVAGNCTTFNSRTCLLRLWAIFILLLSTFDYMFYFKMRQTF